MSPSILSRAAFAAGFIASTVSAAYNAGSTQNVAIYWGQGDSQITLSEVCKDSSIDIVNIAFVNGFPKKVGEYPKTNHGNACDGYYDDPFDSTKKSGLLKSCPGVEEAIGECQAAGKKVLMSLGGGYPLDYYLPSQEVAEYFADFLLGAYGPLTEAWTKAGKPRPFGAAAVNGFDLDLEAVASEVPSAEYIYKNYNYLVTQIKSKQPSMLISSAPQCQVPDVRLSDAISKSHFDMIFTQFYNTEECSAYKGYQQINAASTTFSFDTWVSWLKANSFNKGVKLYMGLPAGPKGSPSYPAHALKPEEANALITKYQKKHPTIFGGAMLWEATVSKRNPTYGQSYGYWMKAVLDGTFASKYKPVVSSSSSSTRMSTSTRASSSTPASSTSVSLSRSSSAVSSSVRSSSTLVRSSSTVSSSVRSSSTPIRSSSAQTSSTAVRSSSVYSSSSVRSSSVQSSSTPVRSSSVYVSSSTPVSFSSVYVSSSVRSSSVQVSSTPVRSSSVYVSSSTPVRSSSVYVSSSTRSSSAYVSSSAAPSSSSVRVSSSSVIRQSSSYVASSTIESVSVSSSVYSVASSSAHVDSSSIYIPHPSETSSSSVYPASSASIIYVAGTTKVIYPSASSTPVYTPSVPYPVYNASSSVYGTGYLPPYGDHPSSTLKAASSTPCTTSAKVHESSIAYPVYPASSKAHSEYPAYPAESSKASSEYAAYPTSSKAYGDHPSYPESSKAYGNGYDSYASVTKKPEYEAYPVTTTYVDVCETGLTTITTTYTKTVCKSCAQPTKEPAYPENWTTSVYVDKTVTLTITKPMQSATSVPSYPSKPSVPSSPEQPSKPVYAGEYPKESGKPAYPEKPSKGEYPVEGEKYTSTKVQVITLTKVAVPYTAVPSGSSVPYVPAPYVPKNGTTAGVPHATGTGSYAKPSSPAEFQGAASRLDVGLTAVFGIVVAFLFV